MLGVLVSLHAIDRLPPRAARAAAALLALGLIDCTGAGDGAVTGPVSIPVCRVGGTYDLHPSFYGADRYGTMMWIRIQDGGGSEEYADSLTIAIRDTGEIARRIAASTTLDAQGRPVVTLPVGAASDPTVLVSALFTPSWSCGRRKVTRLGQTVGLPSVAGTITFRSVDDPGGAGSNPRLTDVTNFRFELRDDRPVGPNNVSGVSPDGPVGNAELSGWFRFVFSESVPAQMFR